MNFGDATSVAQDDDVLTAVLSDAWAIAGPNGGYMSAIALRAAALGSDPLFKPCSIAVQYLSRAQPGHVEIRSAPMGGGRNAQCVQVSLDQGDREVLRAQTWMRPETSGPVLRASAMPDVPGPDAVPAVDTRSRGHGFWGHFDIRPIGDASLSDRFAPRTHRAWFRYRDFEPGHDPWLDRARYVVLIDTLVWPTFVRTENPRPDFGAVSLDLAAWFHGAGGADDWLLVESVVGPAAAGALFGSCSIWSCDGALLANGGSQMSIRALTPAGDRHDRSALRKVSDR